MNAQTVGGASISFDDAHERKVTKYQNIASTWVTAVKIYDLSAEIDFSFTSVTFLNRGIWSGSLPVKVKYKVYLSRQYLWPASYLSVAYKRYG